MLSDIVRKKFEETMNIELDRTLISSVKSFDSKKRMGLINSVEDATFGYKIGVLEKSFANAFFDVEKRNADGNEIQEITLFLLDKQKEIKSKVSAAVKANT
jgi:hypothetical protein